MTVFGADPDTDTKSLVNDWGGPPPSWSTPWKGDQGQLAKYFTYHPKMVARGLSRQLTPRDKGMLVRHFSKQLRRGYSPADLRTVVDRFFNSRFGSRSDQPVLAFVSKHLQESLMEGITPSYVISSVPVSKSRKLSNRTPSRTASPVVVPLCEEDHALVFIAKGFVRDDNMVLSWDEELDEELTKAAVDPVLSAVAHTYPDALAYAIVNYIDDMDALYSHFELICQQYEYLLGVVESPAPLEDGYPPDFRSGKKLRERAPSLSEAVRRTVRG